MAKKRLPRAAKAVRKRTLRVVEPEVHGDVPGDVPIPPAQPHTDFPTLNGEPLYDIEEGRDWTARALDRIWQVLLVLAIAIGVVALFWIVLHFAPRAHARDLGQWDPNDPVVRWYSSLMQPDNPDISCCGKADAYWADESAVTDDGHGAKQVIAIITDDRDDDVLHRAHVPVGTRYVIPPNKITRKDGNPTGHVIIFLSAGGETQYRDVLCYVMNGGV